MPIPDGIEFLTPWRVIGDPSEIQDRAGRLSERLQSEVPEKHVLHGLKVKAIATRIERDDVLFEIEGGEMRLAVVHMTWRKESDPRWPDTTLFQSWDDWVRDDCFQRTNSMGCPEGGLSAMACLNLFDCLSCGGTMMEQFQSASGIHDI